jgi:hypothetical protein
LVLLFDFAFDAVEQRIEASLYRFTNLDCLSLVMRYDGGLYLPSLETTARNVTLGGPGVNARDLQNFCQRHKHSLQVLKLDALSVNIWIQADRVTANLRKQMPSLQVSVMKREEVT